ncbi:MAG: heavy-metal-associated domain-containing protein [Flavobacteriales bacterium]|nr:heavy-metal-associated domain-containing protein [Flavobacteriales bacterium]HRH69239.1 heavy metal-associated domain-containing protein [Flavobacteriales bacterium]
MKIHSTLFFVLLSTIAIGQDKNIAHLEIHTSTVCEMCEKTIEDNMIYEKGVKSVHVDLEASLIHVDYDVRKTGPDALRTAVTKLGYYADGAPGDEKAFKNLPACCQKEGCGKVSDDK